MYSLSKVKDKLFRLYLAFTSSAQGGKQKALNENPLIRRLNKIGSINDQSPEQIKDRIIEAITLAEESKLSAVACDQYNNSQAVLVFLYGGIDALDEYIRRIEQAYGVGSAFDSANAKEAHFFLHKCEQTQASKTYQLYMLEHNRRFPSENSIQYYCGVDAVHA